MKHTTILGLALLAAATHPLQGQDLWDSGFRLTAGMMSGADTAELGQNKTYGLAIVGAYPLTPRHGLVFEGGYRLFPTASQTLSGLRLDDKTDGVFLGAAYRYHFVRGRLDGLYCQGGLRIHALRTQRDVVEFGAASDGSDLRTALKGARTTSARPMVGAGFRFTERLSLEVNLVGIEAENVKGVAKSGTLVELSLGMHL